MKWHAGRSDDYVSPLAPGGRCSASIAERARERTLSDDELRAVWLAAEKDKTFRPLRALRAVDGNEARRGGWPAAQRTVRRRQALDHPRAAATRSDRDMVIPLSAAAQKIIATMPDRGDHVFSATGSQPLYGFNVRKANLRHGLRRHAIGGCTICAERPER